MHAFFMLMYFGLIPGLLGPSEPPPDPLAECNRTCYRICVPDKDGGYYCPPPCDWPGCDWRSPPTRQPVISPRR